MWKRRVVVQVSNEQDTVQQVFSEVRIDFVMQSYLGWSADECRIDLYNLDPAIVTTLYKLEGKKFKLMVGYQDETLQVLMAGSVTNVYGRKQLPNHITTLWCIPFSALTNNTDMPTKEFTNKTVREILESLIEDKGYGKKSTRFIGFETGKDSRLNKLVKNYSTEGTFLQELTKITALIGARFQCADEHVRIISNTINNRTVDLMKADGVAVHKINVYEVKGTPELSVASTNITVNLNSNIKAGDVIDYTKLGETPTSMQSIFGVGGVGGVLYRDPNIYKYVVYNQYQILTVTHTGSNYAPVWETAITGTVFNEYVTAGDPAAQDGSGIEGYIPSVAGIQLNADGSLTAYLPAVDYNTTGNADIDKQAQNAANVQLTKEQQQILYEVAGPDEEKRKMLETILRVENRGFGKVNNDAVSPVGAVGAFQFMPKTAENLGVANRRDFRQSAQGASKYIDEVRARHGSKFTPEVMYADYNAGPRASGPLARGENVNLPEETKNYLAIASALNGGG